MSAKLPAGITIYDVLVGVLVQAAIRGDTEATKRILEILERAKAKP